MIQSVRTAREKTKGDTKGGKKKEKEKEVRLGQIVRVLRVCANRVSNPGEGLVLLPTLEAIESGV